MRVLLVAPRIQELPNIDREVAGIVNSGLSVRLLNGDVSRTDIVKAISDGEFDLLWLASHGVHEGVYLSDGILDASALITYVVSNGIRHVFLNTCDSMLVANVIAQGAGVDVIATVGQVGDKRAFETGVLLASHLSKGMEFRQAYELSKPGQNENYIFLTGVLRAGVRRQGSVGTDTQSAMLAHVEQQLRRVTTLIDGDASYGIAGIRKDLAQVLLLIGTAQNEMDALRGELRSVAAQLAEERREREAMRQILAEEQKSRAGMQAQLDDLTRSLAVLGVGANRTWWREWVAPILSLVTVVLLFYMIGVIGP